jgi:hypothetical protein
MLFLVYLSTYCWRENNGCSDKWGGDTNTHEDPLWGHDLKTQAITEQSCKGKADINKWKVLTEN